MSPDVERELKKLSREAALCGEYLMLLRGGWLCPGGHLEETSRPSQHCSAAERQTSAVTVEHRLAAPACVKPRATKCGVPFANPHMTAPDSNF